MHIIWIITKFLLVFFFFFFCFVVVGWYLSSNPYAINGSNYSPFYWNYNQPEHPFGREDIGKEDIKTFFLIFCFYFLGPIYTNRLLLGIGIIIQIMWTCYIAFGFCVLDEWNKDGVMLYYKLYGWVWCVFYVYTSAICLWKGSLTMFSSLDLLLFGVCCITFCTWKCLFLYKISLKFKLSAVKMATSTWQNLH